MNKLFDKMIDHPFASIIVIGAIVDGLSILAYNAKVIFRK